MADTERSSECSCRPEGGLSAHGNVVDLAKSLILGGDLNRSTQHLLILLDKEVADGDVTDIVHGEAEG